VAGIGKLKWKAGYPMAVDLCIGEQSPPPFANTMETWGGSQRLACRRAAPRNGRSTMLYTIAVILLVLWALGGGFRPGADFRDGQLLGTLPDFQAEPEGCQSGFASA
jgi:hypothetical protein